MAMTDEEKQLKMRRLGMEASYLAGCALADRIPEPDESVDLEDLYRFCKFHSITSIVAMALDSYWQAHPTDAAIMAKWCSARDKAIRKNVMLNAERERILNHLESIGCWYMPLKGSFLQFDYPKFGMRQMSDNDILYDEAKTKEVHDFLTGSGYRCEEFGKSYHDEYVKPPIYNMEMHRYLFVSVVYTEMSAYYRDVKARLIKDTGNQFGYHFSPEDFYIFMVAHAYKHYLGGGIGIRNLLDVYVYLKKHGDRLDWAYLEKELRSFGAWDFSQECRDLARKLFSENCTGLTEADILALDLYFASGAFGTRDRLLQNRVDSRIAVQPGGKFRYILKRVFPSVEYLAENAPVLRKMPWLAPVFYIKRLFVMLFKRRDYVVGELRVLKDKRKKV